MSKRAIAIIGAAAGVALILALYGLIVRRILLQREEQAVLEEQVRPLETALAGRQEKAQSLPARQAELEAVQAELAIVRAELVAARLAFPSELDSTEVLAHIVATAAIHRANLRQVQAHDPVTTTVDTGTYRILTYDVEAEGELDSLAEFLTGLESGPVGTLSLSQVHIEALPTPTAASPTMVPTSVATRIGTPTIYRASLVVQVYVRLVQPGSPLLPSASTPLSPEKGARQLEILIEEARQAEDWEYAISFLLMLRQARAPDPALDAQLVEAYVRQGRRLLAAGQYDRAGTDFRAALVLQPDNGEAQAGLEALAALTPTPLPTPTGTLAPTRQ